MHEFYQLTTITSMKNHVGNFNQRGFRYFVGLCVFENLDIYNEEPVGDLRHGLGIDEQVLKEYSDRHIANPKYFPIRNLNLKTSCLKKSRRK